jgi:hypothetical protein
MIEDVIMREMEQGTFGGLAGTPNRAVAAEAKFDRGVARSPSCAARGMVSLYLQFLLKSRSVQRRQQLGGYYPLGLVGREGACFRYGKASDEKAAPEPCEATE